MVGISHYVDLLTSSSFCLALRIVMSRFFPLVTSKRLGAAGAAATLAFSGLALVPGSTAEITEITEPGDILLRKSSTLSLLRCYVVYKTW